MKFSIRKQLLTKDTFFSEDLMTTVMAMENGDITEVIEEEDGIRIRMVNNNSPEAYNRTVEEAIKEEEKTFGENM